MNGQVVKIKTWYVLPIHCKSPMQICIEKRTEWTQERNCRLIRDGASTSILRTDSHQRAMHVWPQRKNFPASMPQQDAGAREEPVTWAGAAFSRGRLLHFTLRETREVRARDKQRQRDYKSTLCHPLHRDPERGIPEPARH